MARIAGVNIPSHKHIVIGLTAIYGIGRSRSMKICQHAKIDPTTKVKDLAEAELDAIRAVLEKYELEGDLRRKEAMDIKRLMELGTYRGTRHRRGLPARGQRTRSNARTAKRGNKGARKKQQQTQTQKADAK